MSRMQGAVSNPRREAISMKKRGRPRKIQVAEPKAKAKPVRRWFFPPFTVIDLEAETSPGGEEKHE